MLTFVYFLESLIKRKKYNKINKSYFYMLVDFFLNKCFVEIYISFFFSYPCMKIEFFQKHRFLIILLNLVLIHIFMIKYFS